MKRGDNSSALKNISLLLLIVLFLFGLSSVVSAQSAGCCIGSGCLTLVEGNITYADSGNFVEGADVIVTCNHGTGFGTVSENAVSSSNGNYYVIFCQTDCDKDDEVTVEATKNGLSGINTGYVEYRGYIDVAIVNVPLVPEFGLIAGAATIFGALGVFFIVRKR